MELIKLSWKSVELQVALPQTQELGKLQDEMSKNNQRLQEALATSQLREERLKRKQVKETNETTQEKLKQDKEEKELMQSRLKKRNKNQKKQLKHPYLVSKFDFNG